MTVLFEVLKSEIPTLTPTTTELFETFGIETARALPITDAVWTKMRTHDVGMPQMAVSGLSESWLFKESGLPMAFVTTRKTINV